MLWSVDMLSPKSPQQPQERSIQGVDTRLLSTDSSKLCNICGPGADVELVESRRVSYAGNNTTCGDLSASFHLSTKESSFTCSLARSSLASLCCVESCQVCPNGEEIKAKAKIDHGGKQVSCADYELTLRTSGFPRGSDECDSSVSRVAAICCLAKVEDEAVFSLVQTPSITPNICERDNVHHELKSEAMVEYKGTSISCLDLNSILAKNEVEGSDIFLATQSMLFDGCCYEKCSLCGDKSLRWDATVKYNNQILSCDELPPMLTLGTVLEGSEQCDAMQVGYSSICCFKPPKKKCNICNKGSILLEVNKHSFVKTRSSSLHCVNFVNGLAERVEEGSEVCEDSKLAYSTVCCNTTSLPNTETSYDDWVDNPLVPSSSDAPFLFLKISLWSLITTSLLFTLQ